MTCLISHEGQRIGEKALPDLEDDPIAELEYLEQCFASKMDQTLQELGPQVRWLGRQGIDVDLEGIVSRAKEDFQDDTGHHLVSQW